MKKKILINEEKGLTRKLYEQAFPEDSKSFVDFYYSNKNLDNIIWAISEGTDILSMLHLNPYMLSFSKKSILSFYIVAVATDKNHRHQGMMRDLLSSSLKEMSLRNVPFAFLMPVSEDIYKPFGFRTVYEQHEKFIKEDETVQEVLSTPDSFNHLYSEYVYQIEKSLNCYKCNCDMSKEVNIDISNFQIRPIEEKDYCICATIINERLNKDYDVFAIRNPEYYKNLTAEYRSDGGDLKILTYKDQIIDVLPMNSETPSGIGTDTKSHPKIMVRITNLKYLFLCLKTSEDISVTLSIKDDIIEENNKVYSIMAKKNLSLNIGVSNKKECEEVITIEALEDFLFSVKDIDEIRKYKDVRLSDKACIELNKIIRMKNIYLNEIV
ncbi:MAG: GNAT family N-acetyltransferase [Lachnospiraceae bacterium]|nr:GNAT family N-acetyltransferase [Lachnospiraceae bacterium]